jgi:hypothetical protein
MTIDWESVIDRAAPVVRKVYEIVVYVVTLCCGTVLTFVGIVSLIFSAAMLRLPDAVLWLRLQGHWASVSDQRNALTLLGAAGVVVLIYGLHLLHDLFRPHGQDTHAAARVAALENQLREAEQFADEAAQSAAEAEWMRDTLAAVEYLFGIPGVLKAARKAARKALHPDGHPEASPDEIHDLTERFQMAEAVFDRFSSN